MAKLELQGCGSALVTPFKDGAVDYDAFRRIVARQVENGVDFLLPLGTTGETPCLSFEEKVKIYQIARAEAKGRPVIIGCGTNSLEATMAAIHQFEPYKPDAFLVVAPYYNKPTQAGLYQYFKLVAESTTIPVLLYNVPSRTGVNIKAPTTVSLAKDCPNIIGVKEASGLFAQTSEIVKDAPSDFMVFSGDDILTLPFMAVGAKGVISVASNIAPREVSAMVHAIQAGDYATARELHHRLTPLFRGCFVESNPVPAKAALCHMGLCRNEFRLPMVPGTPETCELVAKVVDDLKLDY